MLALNEAQQLLGGLFFLDDGVANVGPVEAADELLGVLQLQALQDVGPRQIVCRGGQRDARHAGIAFVQHGQGPVFRAKVVAPLAHAMRFVNGKQTELATLVHGVELGQKACRGHALWGGVQQRDVTTHHALLDGVGLFTAQCGV